MCIYCIYTACVHMHVDKATYLLHTKWLAGKYMYICSTSQKSTVCFICRTVGPRLECNPPHTCRKWVAWAARWQPCRQPGGGPAGWPASWALGLGRESSAWGAASCERTGIWRAPSVSPCRKKKKHYCQHPIWEVCCRQNSLLPRECRERGYCLSDRRWARLLDCRRSYLLVVYEDIRRDCSDEAD